MKLRVKRPFFVQGCLGLLLWWVMLPLHALEAPKATIEFSMADYQVVDVVQMITSRSRPGDKRRYFIEPVPVRFEAVLRQTPKSGQFELVYDALLAWGVSPVPTVDHSTYLEVATGTVIPVYMTRESAALANTRFQVGEHAEFYALHIYDYEKGPRFLVVDVQSLASPN